LYKHSEQREELHSRLREEMHATAAPALSVCRSRGSPSAGADWRIHRHTDEFVGLFTPDKPGNHCTAGTVKGNN